MSEFDKTEYWANRKAGVRGQGVQGRDVMVLRPGAIKDKDNIGRTIKPAMMGINAFKRKHTPSFGGNYNPKHRSIRGKILRTLKAESWNELIDRERKFY